MFAALINHIWQSTIFAVAAALLVLAFRQNRAQSRYALWLAASLKFLVPFALLISLGASLWNALPTRNIAQPIAAPTVAQTMVQIAQPVPETLPFTPAAPNATNWLLDALVVVWACGFLAIALIRFRGWLRIRAAVRASTPIEIPAPVEVRSSADLLEPGVVGLFRPTLLMPEGILETLTPAQLEAVLAHELAHIRRHDNLTAALHMVVEAIFWFHPFVWWIGARLIDERERACDEAVLSLGNEPRDYVEAILNVCKLYLESPLACVSGVTGKTINARVRAILARHLGGDMRIGKKFLLAAACFAALVVPITIGMMIARPTHAQREGALVAASQSAADANSPQQMAPRPAGRSMPNPASTADYIEALGTVTATSVVVRPRVDGQLTSINFKEGSLVKQGQVLASLDGDALQSAEAQLQKDEAQLAATPTIEQLKEAVRSDQIAIEDQERAMPARQIVAPITGIAGFLQVDVGNVVHSGQALVVINQLQPIAAIFSVDQSYLPRVFALQRDGIGPTVELLDRDNRKRIAVGHLAAVDNEVDDATDTVKLKADFDNKNDALFPNELVIAHMDLRAR